MNKKSVVITGGSRGIGLSFVNKFISEGYFVVAGSRKKTNNLNFNPQDFCFIEMDVANLGDHKLLVKKAIEKTGNLNVYINNAGYSEWRSIEKIDQKFLQNIFNINLFGAFWGSKAALEGFGHNGGAIINISSIAGKRGSANNSAYSATKFAMNGLTQSLAKELGSRNIRVNSICPVLVSTGGLLEALKNKESPSLGNPENFLSKFAKENAALKRLPITDEVSEMCLFLASDKSSAITGQCINVDCGVFPQ